MGTQKTEKIHPYTKNKIKNHMTLMTTKHGCFFFVVAFAFIATSSTTTTTNMVDAMNVVPKNTAVKTKLKKKTPPPAKTDQSWDEIISSSKVVESRDEALALCSSGESVSKLFFIQSLKKFWLWHLPILSRVWVISLFIRTIRAFHWRDSLVAALQFLLDIILRDTVWLLGISDDRSVWLSLIVFVGRTLIATIILMGLRLYQRLSWRTTEFGNFESVKDDPRYQNEKLLNKAWALASKQGWPDPTKCEDFQDGVGGGSVVMQPCPGYCGVATLNSALRSFGGTCQGTNAPPYVTMPSSRRYVTMEEMEKLACTMVGNDSKWVAGGGSPVESMQVLRCGPNGIRTLEQFRTALRQTSHPNQPARIMAIYSRGPLFFCSKGRSTMSKLASFAMVHWSPVLAYLEEEDLVLVMDVNHTYGPKGYLLPVDRFYDSVRTRDIYNGEYHGLLLLRPPPLTNRPPLLSNPADLSVTFGKMKKAYYEHQAAGRCISALDILKSNDGGYEPLQGKDFEEKCIRFVTPGNSDSVSCGISAVISSHPVFFANEIFLGKELIPSLESLRSFMKVFSQLKVPARLVLRGFDESSSNDIHQVLTAAGMVPIMKPYRMLFLNINPATKYTAKYSVSERLPNGYFIEEVLWDPKNEKGNSSSVEALGKLIATSYKFPVVNRRGYSPADFMGHAYKTFSHGGNLRHFACYDRETKEMVACVALFCDRSGNEGTRPDVAAIFNVCTSPNHRRKGLGKTMSLYAIEEARNVGCMQIILEASPAGKPIYESLGFTTMTDDFGGAYASLSVATDDFKWKNTFRLMELFFRLKNCVH